MTNRFTSCVCKSGDFLIQRASFFVLELLENKGPEKIETPQTINAHSLHTVENSNRARFPRFCCLSAVSLERLAIWAFA